MTTSSKAVTSATPAGSSVSSSGASEASPIPAVVAQVSPVGAVASAPAKLSRSQKTAANIASSSSRLAAQPQAPVPSMTEITQPDIELSPGVANMSAADVAKAFMGKQLETASEEENNTETEATSETEEEVTAETETETNEEESSETETETEVENDSPVTGITKELQAKGVSPKLIKRFEDLAKQNSERGELLKRQENKPLVVLSPTQSSPLANVVNEADIDAAVKTTVADARIALRKLQRMDGVGGTWDEGGANERELTPEDVDAWINHFEDLRDNAHTIGQERKLYLKTYAETAEALGKPASELVSPKVETRESKLIRQIPELMRDPEYLRILADAQVGRELREKKANGIRTVEIEPKAKPKAAVSAKAAPTASTPAVRTSAPVRSPDAGLTLDELRTKAGNGDKAAQAELTRRFLQPA